jgi:hypothetical protein
VEDENGDLLAHSQTFHNPSHKDSNLFIFGIAISKLKRYKSPGSDKIPTELKQAKGDTLQSEIHKIINYNWNKENWLSSERSLL